MAEWLVHCGDDVVDAVRLMESGPKGDKRLVPYTWKCLESIFDPADFRELVTVMRDETLRQTASRLRTEAARIVRNRHWTWLIMHPGLTSSYIHPERSMRPAPSVCDEMVVVRA